MAAAMDSPIKFPWIGCPSLWQQSPALLISMSVLHCLWFFPAGWLVQTDKESNFYFHWLRSDNSWHISSCTRVGKTDHHCMLHRFKIAHILHKIFSLVLFFDCMWKIWCIRWHAHFISLAHLSTLTFGQNQLILTWFSFFVILNNYPSLWVIV